MNTLSLRIALCVGLFSALHFNAAAAPDNLAKFDLNGDSYIDKTEFLSAANQKFSEMDANANGVVTKDEREAFRTLKREMRAQNKFSKTDANADGVITQQEYDAARAERSDKREARRAEHQAQREARGESQRGQRDGKRHERTRFQPDANDDGVIDVAEHTAAAEHKFARMDKDGDGVLSQDELKRGKRKGHKKRRGHGNDGMGR